MFTSFSIFAVVIVGLGVFTHYYLQRAPDMPKLDLNRWWGDGNRPNQEDVTIRPFKIVFNETMIDDLKMRLRNRRPYTRPLEGMQSEYGMNTIYLEKLLKYWQDEYDFKGRADLLNRYPHYKTRVQGLDIHYMRVKPEAKGKQVLPILLMHGWPSSSKEFDQVIPMLTTPRNGYDFIFEVIAVDLPGFGFSEGTNKPGLDPLQIGILMKNLMKRLGFDKFYIQAGDWGSQAATHMCTVFPDDILGFHTNMPVSIRRISNMKTLFGSLFPSLAVEDKYRHRMYPLSDTFSYLMREGGYFHLQATKPDTIGAALTDTPAGMAAYIFEKIAMASNKNQLDTPHGGLESIALDDLLDTATILWANERITTSMRLYAEAFAPSEIFIVHEIPTKVPTAAIKFLHEIVYQPDWILRDKFTNLVHSTTLDVGGHFAGMHTPRELADDVFESVVEFIKFHEKYDK
ncbi:juvenile hormone epoxide hydrolase-like [Vanessa cardui]|uniref:juvenile hormone epoxide hydrolase-like n=1 Tax=Vanessa cardui TaxID=171605 RepID=UPI001F12ECFF|nr:juvenile hormone epoxide hydrolase-like [Vanessa cardui]